jgi:hypothetical protein
MASADEVAVSAFPQSTSNNRPNAYNLYGGGFTSDKSLVKAAINSVGNPDGGTPLYQSMMSSLAYTAANGRNANKALIAFTDGENNDGAATEADVIADAKRRGIPVFSVGLKDGNRTSLSRIARETNGAFFYASDALQLSAAYKSLSAILGGRALICTVSIKTDLSGTAVSFTQSTGSAWIFTRGVKIDGVSVPFTFRQSFDVVNR